MMGGEGKGQGRKGGRKKKKGGEFAFFSPLLRADATKKSRGGKERKEEATRSSLKPGEKEVEKMGRGGEGKKGEAIITFVPLLFFSLLLWGQRGKKNRGGGKGKKREKGVACAAFLI